MNRKSLIWYVTTVVLSMVLNTTVVFASDDSADTFDSIESNPLSTYETSTDSSNVPVDSSQVETSITSIEGEEYTTTLEFSSVLAVETFESVEDTTSLDIPSETTSDADDSQSISLDETTETTTVLETDDLVQNVETTSSFEKSSYVDESFNIVNPLESLTSSEEELAIISGSSSNEVTQTSNLVYTLSNTSIQKDDSSPKTDHVAVIVPILLVMAGALFIGATSTPKRQ